MNDYTAHPEYLALIETVCTHPVDDAPRGILADWIQEHGDDERGEFIRKQLASPDWRIEWQSTSAGDWVSSGSGDPATDTMMRELIMSGMLDGWGSGAMIAFRRGFVEEIRLPREVFTMMGFARLFFRAHPVTTLVFKEHYVHTFTASDGSEMWNAFTFLADGGRLRGTGGTREQAVSGLSSLCVAHCREQAGLPPL
ncbi:TIGR02996 domain-containing protein [Zavarzinella formosa]|uniref:TIGR02996 domain-containing protein n=1 Tax=Zavarzinella formosa TaxID=360055 RepID=UPI0002FE9AE3|nr:TIGR02996 domain-containing protein [Zavarzinella formosa]